MEDLGDRRLFVCALTRLQLIGQLFIPLTINPVFFPPSLLCLASGYITNNLFSAPAVKQQVGNNITARFLLVGLGNRISRWWVGPLQGKHIFFCNPIWGSLRITVFSTYQGASTIMRKAFDWKHSRISMLEVEAVPQSCIPNWFEYCFIYEKFVVCREF
jgi:hypothetical protein